MTTDLSAFIEHAREKGMDHTTIRMLLLSGGWKEKDVVEALAKTSLEMGICWRAATHRYSSLHKRIYSSKEARNG